MKLMSLILFLCTTLPTHADQLAPGSGSLPAETNSQEFKDLMKALHPKDGSQAVLVRVERFEPVQAISEQCDPRVIPQDKTVSLTSELARRHFVNEKRFMGNLSEGVQRMVREKMPKTIGYGSGNLITGVAALELVRQVYADPKHFAQLTENGTMNYFGGVVRIDKQVREANCINISEENVDAQIQGEGACGRTYSTDTTQWRDVMIDRVLDESPFSVNPSGWACYLSQDLF